MDSDIYLPFCKTEQIFCYNRKRIDAVNPSCYLPKEARMDFSSINWLAVLVCVVVAMAVGFFWFGPKSFYPMWWKAIGKSENEQMGTGMNPALMWPLTILAAFVEAVFMSLMVHAMGSMTPGGATLASGALAGFMLWLGFVATTSLTNKLFANQLTAWVLEMGDHLIVMVLMGAILGVWH